MESICDHPSAAGGSNQCTAGRTTTQITRGFRDRIAGFTARVGSNGARRGSGVRGNTDTNSSSIEAIGQANGLNSALTFPLADSGYSPVEDFGAAEAEALAELQYLYFAALDMVAQRNGIEPLYPVEEIVLGASAVRALGAGYRAIAASVSASVERRAIAERFLVAMEPALATIRGPGNWIVTRHRMSPRSAIYQSKITGMLPDVDYLVNGVKFDGFANGILLEAKGFGYARWVKNGVFKGSFRGAAALERQAARQLAAAPSGARIQWHFAEEDAANATRVLFERQGVKGIEVLFSPR